MSNIYLGKDLTLFIDSELFDQNVLIWCFMYGLVHITRHNMTRLHQKAPCFWTFLTSRHDFIYGKPLRSKQIVCMKWAYQMVRKNHPALFFFSHFWKLFRLIKIQCIFIKKLFGNHSKVSVDRHLFIFMRNFICFDCTFEVVIS